MSMTPQDILKQEGEINEILEGNLSPDKEGYEIQLETGQNCNLCKINRYPYHIDENIYFEDEDFYIVETNELKGHSIRNMAVIKEHGSVPSISDRQGIKEELAEITSRQIREGEMIIFGSMNTFPEHYHLIASDLEGDIKPIHDYELYSVEKGEYRLKERKIRSRLGQKLL